jgi:hypothetical protein
LLLGKLSIAHFMLLLISQLKVVKASSTYPFTAIFKSCTYYLIQVTNTLLRNITRHFCIDFRFDVGGCALSYAMSNGPSRKPGLNMLATEMPLHSV